MVSFAKRFFKDEDGASAVEYAILVALVAVAVSAAVSLFDISGLFSKASTTVSSQIK